MPIPSQFLRDRPSCLRPQFRWWRRRKVRLAITPELVVGPASNRLRSHALSQVGSEVAYAPVSMFQPSRRSRRRTARSRGGFAVAQSVPQRLGAIGAIVVLQLQRQVGGFGAGVRVMPGPRPSANRVPISPFPKSFGRFQSTLDTTLPERFWTPKPRSGSSKRPDALNGTPTSRPPTRSRAFVGGESGIDHFVS